jgi:CelD/BcsL family acetyltransferase involved in cellulose biosynthesis
MMPTSFERPSQRWSTSVEAEAAGVAAASRARSLRPARDSGSRVRAVGVRQALDQEAALRWDWDALSRDDPTRSALWQLAWYRAFGDVQRDPVFVAEEGERSRVIGLLPLHWDRSGPRGALRVLASTTNGHSGYTALLLREGCPAALGALLDGAVKLPAWDVLKLDGVRDDDVARISAWGRERGIAVDIVNPQTTAILTFGDDRAASIPARTRKTRSRERQLGEIGKLEFSVVSEPERVRTAFRDYLDAERKSWKARDGELLTSTPRITRFYQELIAGSDDCAGVWLHLLKLDGAIIAGSCSVRKDGGMVANKSFFDERYKKYAPGTIMEHRILESLASDRRVRRVDFYTSLDHYRHFTNHVEGFHDVRIWSSGLRGRTARFLWVRRLRSASKSAG